MGHWNKTRFNEMKNEQKLYSQSVSQEVYKYNVS